jgi:hypothetical protein
MLQYGQITRYGHPHVWPVKRDADNKRGGQAMERTDEDNVIRDKRASVECRQGP